MHLNASGPSKFLVAVLSVCVLVIISKNTDDIKNVLHVHDVSYMSLYKHALQNFNISRQYSKKTTLAINQKKN